jgi:hypothetical protein
MKCLVHAVSSSSFLAPVLLLSLAQPGFGGPKVTVGRTVAAAETVSLDQIEHEVLRKLGEPRIHFAIVRASRSCPRLLNRAYTAVDLDNQLVFNTQDFFGDPGNFRHDSARRVFHLSSILSWFADDFGSDQAARLRTIAPYLPTREAYQAAVGNSVTASYLDYDWGLNAQTAPQSERR